MKTEYDFSKGGRGKFFCKDATLHIPICIDAIVQVIDDHRHELVNRYGVQSLALFGSVVRGEANPDSDIDMLVEFNRPTGYFGLVALQDYLTALLQQPVDLGTVRSLKPRIRSCVECEMRYVL